MSASGAAPNALRSPEGERHGRVFNLAGRSGRPLHWQEVGRIVSRIGKRAGVVVNSDGKPASAHDLRRSFRSRWARRVMPAVLQRLMRHGNITTTMGYYVALDADELADELWENHAGNGAPAEKQEQEIGPT